MQKADIFQRMFVKPEKQSLQLSFFFLSCFSKRQTKEEGFAIGIGFANRRQETLYNLPSLWRVIKYISIIKALRSPISFLKSSSPPNRLLTSHRTYILRSFWKHFSMFQKNINDFSQFFCRAGDRKFINLQFILEE